MVGLVDRQIQYLSATHVGKTHDKKVVDKEQLSLPPDTWITHDLGFKGCELGERVKVVQPYKKPPRGALTEEEKAHNRWLASIRVTVEHVISGIKRCRCVKDVYRNTTPGFEDLILLLACGLHNFRTAHRHHVY
ncbi:transposase family protein [Thiofilum flexile]|uniref:transposase family protein n=1 Tax=Thiofilum flexile TaxID=125627 RepID=UPI0009FC43C8|nr:transposase family protein [Thiofilum flexile]